MAHGRRADSKTAAVPRMLVRIRTIRRWLSYRHASLYGTSVLTLPASGDRRISPRRTIHALTTPYRSRAYLHRYKNSASTFRGFDQFIARIITTLVRLMDSSPARRPITVGRRAAAALCGRPTLIGPHAFYGRNLLRLTPPAVRVRAMSPLFVTLGRARGSGRRNNGQACGGMRRGQCRSN